MKPTTGPSTAAPRATSRPRVEARRARPASITAGTTSRRPTGRVAPAARPTTAAHHHARARSATMAPMLRARRVPSAYPITWVKAAGARHSNHAARRASASSPVSRRANTASSATATSDERFATTTSAVPKPMPGTDPSTRVSNGTSGKKRSDRWPAPAYPTRAMVSYHPASHPSSPSWTRVATATLGLASVTNSWEASRAPATTSRAVTQGSAAVRNPQAVSPGEDRARRAQKTTREGAGSPVAAGGFGDGADDTGASTAGPVPGPPSSVVTAAGPARGCRRGEARMTSW